MTAAAAVLSSTYVAHMARLCFLLAINRGGPWWRGGERVGAALAPKLSMIDREQKPYEAMWATYMHDSTAAAAINCCRHNPCIGHHTPQARLQGARPAPLPKLIANELLLKELLHAPAPSTAKHEYVNPCKLEQSVTGTGVQTLLIGIVPSRRKVNQGFRT